MSESNLGFTVLQPGLLSLIQDAGRFGYHSIGLTTGGPLDPEAFHWANRLCDNDSGSSAIEVSVGGLVLESQINTVIAVTGADMPLLINGKSAELWCSHAVKAGDRIELGFSSHGCRSYLAVAGGFQVAPSFGSSATVCRESIGGLNGGQLAEGDHLPCQAIVKHRLQQLAFSDRPQYSKEISLRVILSYQHETFSSLQKNIFFSNEYQVSDRCDRMGYRLEGPKVSSSIDGILSEGICLGAIQVPADGQPIVLLNDRQTIGGYPKIASVISTDIARLAQLLPGAKVHFESVSIEQAHNLYHYSNSQFHRKQMQSC